MKICVCGLIKSGKTTLMNMLKQHHYQTFIVDEYINEIYQYQRPGWLIINNYLNDVDVYDIVDNKIDKSKLLKFILENPNKWEEIQFELNVLIFNKIKQFDSKQLIFIELGSYLTYESFFKELFDYVIYIKVDKARLQTHFDRANLVLNKNHPGYIQDDSIKADLIINNNSSYNDYLQSLNAFIKKIKSN